MSEEQAKKAPAVLQPSLHFKGVERATYEASKGTEGADKKQHEEEEELVLCPVCDYYVSAPGSAVEHLADLRPPERPTYVCRGCDRTFREERALKQHANACWPFEEKMRGEMNAGAGNKETA